MQSITILLDSKKIVIQCIKETYYFLLVSNHVNPFYHSQWIYYIELNSDEILITFYYNPLESITFVLFAISNELLMRLTDTPSESIAF